MTGRRLMVHCPNQNALILTKGLYCCPVPLCEHDGFKRAAKENMLTASAVRCYISTKNPILKEILTRRTIFH